MLTFGYHYNIFIGDCNRNTAQKRSAIPGLPKRKRDDKIGTSVIEMHLPLTMARFITSDDLSKYPVAVFDLDGTLCDTQADVFQIFREALVEKGFPPVADEFIRIGPPLEEMFAEITGKRTDEPIIAELTCAFRKQYDVSDYPNSYLYPGAEPLLQKLKARGVYLAIATYKRAPSTLHLLEVKGILPLFDLTMSIDTEDRAWSKAEMLTRILAEADQSASRAIFFGDTVSDMRAAKEQGVTSVAVMYGYGKPADLHHETPDFYCESLLTL
jgi:phosphoglycolate phosphatase